MKKSKIVAAQGSTLAEILKDRSLTACSGRVTMFLIEKPREISQVYKLRHQTDLDTTIYQILNTVGRKSKHLLTQINIIRAVYYQSVKKGEEQTKLYDTILNNSLGALQHFLTRPDFKVQTENGTRAISTLFYYFGFLLKTDNKSRKELQLVITEIVNLVAKNVDKLLPIEKIDVNTLSYLAGGLARLKMFQH